LDINEVHLDGLHGAGVVACTHPAFQVADRGAYVCYDSIPDLVRGARERFTEDMRMEYTIICPRFNRGPFDQIYFRVWCHIPEGKAFRKHIYDSNESSMTSSNEEEACCCICLEKLTDEDVTTLPCDHIIHTSCFKHYVISRNNLEVSCPLCRSYVIVEIHPVQEEEPPTTMNHYATAMLVFGTPVLFVCAVVGAVVRLVW